MGIIIFFLLVTVPVARGVMIWQFHRPLSAIYLVEVVKPRRKIAAQQRLLQNKVLLTRAVVPPVIRPTITVGVGTASSSYRSASTSNRVPVSNGNRRNGVRSPVNDAPPMYHGTGSLLTPGELAFYTVLQRANANRFNIALKVRLADLTQVVGGAESNWAAFNRVSQKHIDFCLYCQRTTRPLLVIELDDKSHRKHARRERDKLVDQALRQARVPLVRIKARASYDQWFLEKVLKDRTG